MADTLTSLTASLDVPLSDQQFASLLREKPASPTRLLVVSEIREDGEGTTLHFQQKELGHLDIDDPNYRTYVTLARRSQERQNPVGVRFGDGPLIQEIIRADNDMPTEVVDENTDHSRVLFQGHDGIFYVKNHYPESGRIRALLKEGIKQKARVWFIAQKPELTLLDILPAGWSVPVFRISFVVAPDRLLKTADEILRANIRCTKALRRIIRAVAKAYIDEADELKRAVHEIETNAARIQLESLSPPDMIEKARGLQSVQFPNKELQEKVRAVANSYVLIAEKNQQLFDEFKDRYRDALPPRGSSDERHGINPPSGGKPHLLEGPFVAKRRRSKGPSISDDFRRIYAEYPSWIQDTSNARVLERYRQDKNLPADTPIDKKIIANLANLKSLLRKKEREKGGKKLVTTKPGVRGPQRLDLLEELIDDAMSLAKSIDREGLSKVLTHLRAARNSVVNPQAGGTGRSCDRND